VVGRSFKLTILELKPRRQYVIKAHYLDTNPQFFSTIIQNIVCLSFPQVLHKTNINKLRSTIPANY